MLKYTDSKLRASVFAGQWLLLLLLRQNWGCSCDVYNCLLIHLYLPYDHSNATVSSNIYTAINSCFSVMVCTPAPFLHCCENQLKACGLSASNRRVYRHLFMAALCNRGAIIFLPCDFYLLSIFLSIYLFFPRLISAATDWISTILLHMAWP